VVAGEGREEETAMRSAHRKKLASDLWRVHLYLKRGDAERAWAIDEAERLLREHAAELEVVGRWQGTVRAARGGDVDALHWLAQWLGNFRAILEREVPPKPRAPRKPSVSKLIARAEKSGKPVSSITTPDGVTLHFGAAESAGNEWDEVLLRHGKH
jgi:hypothetical protein